MLELNFMIRLVVLLFLSSTCHTSLVQSVCNRSSFSVGLYYAEQRNDLASIFMHINTSTRNVISYNPSSIPRHRQVTYRRIHMREANMTSTVLIKNYNLSHINSIRDLNVTVVCLCVDSSISEDVRLFISCSLRQKEPLDSNSLALVPSPDLSHFIELNEIRALSWNTCSLKLYPLSGWQVNREQPTSQPAYIFERYERVGIRRSTYSFDEGKSFIGLKEGGQWAPVHLGQRVNPPLTAGDQLIVADVNRNHPTLKTCSDSRLSHRAIVGITLGILVVVMSHARYIYNVVYKKRKAKISSALQMDGQVQLMHVQDSESSGVLAEGLAGITIDKAVEFSYEELSKATDGFSLIKKIGQGGFGAIYYAELKGEKAAIKKMDMQESKQFLAELKVLSHVHHLNLVRLIGYCVEGSHFLVYEYIENGNLSQHLQGSGRVPLSWSTRVQIALDSARGLEYIHEYTVSVFVHCDIKSANILIDKNFRGKVADFGLSRLTEVGSRSRLVGTFGYMAPEYARYGDVTPKVDVYAFGVVLYELISAKKAIIRENGFDGEPKGLIALFDEVLSQTDAEDGLVKMIDPRLGDNYPLDSVSKMAQLAKSCTHEDPRQRPHMRSIVVALTNLSSPV